MTKLYKLINSILAEWDPIGVGEDIADYEYRSYISGIIRCVENEGDLMAYIERLFRNTIYNHFSISAMNAR